MSQDGDRAAMSAAFDQEAAAPRSGWLRSGDDEIEQWKREAGGLRGTVTGGPGGNQPGPGFWVFHVVDVSRKPERLVTRGESSRRGWAMDGADQGFPTIQ